MSLNQEILTRRNSAQIYLDGLLEFAEAYIILNDPNDHQLIISLIQEIILINRNICFYQEIIKKMSTGFENQDIRNLDEFMKVLQVPSKI
jgi:hypothetical protein